MSVSYISYTYTTCILSTYPYHTTAMLYKYMCVPPRKYNVRLFAKIRKDRAKVPQIALRLSDIYVQIVCTKAV